MSELTPSRRAENMRLPEGYYAEVTNDSLSWSYDGGFVTPGGGGGSINLPALPEAFLAKHHECRQQAAEISRLRESHEALADSANSRLAKVAAEITRLRTAIVEARRQVEVIAIELSNDYAKYAEQLADKLAATLADALRETT